MALIKNLTTQGVDLVVRGQAKDGVPPTAHIPAGQSKDIDVDLDSQSIKGMAFGGAIEIVALANLPIGPAARETILSSARQRTTENPSQSNHDEGTKQ